MGTREEINSRAEIYTQIYRMPRRDPAPASLNPLMDRIAADPRVSSRRWMIAVPLYFLACLIAGYSSVLAAMILMTAMVITMPKRPDRPDGQR